MISMELAYNVAKLMDLDGSDFEVFYDDCCKGNACDWKEDVRECVPEEVFKMWCVNTNIPEEKRFKITFDVIATDDTDFTKLTEAFREDLDMENIKVKNWYVVYKE